MSGDLDIKQRRLPHWRLDGSIYFVTFRLRTSELAPGEIALVRDHVVEGHQKFYDLLAVVVMPDHVHAALRPNEGIELSRIMKGMKGASARLLNKQRGTSGAVWQDESWDCIVRDPDELLREIDYMFLNPVRKRLIADPWDWPGWWQQEQG